MKFIDNDLLSIQEARILAENAREAQKRLASFPQEKLDEIIESMAAMMDLHAEELAKMSCEETEYGNWQDKLIKNRLACEYLRKRLDSMECVGIIREDSALKTMDVGVPMGVIVALVPPTSPVSTTFYKAMIAIKSGNGIIFSPHPRAKNTINKVVELLIAAAEEAGLPEGAMACLTVLSKSGTVEPMNHGATSLIMNTGVQDLLAETMAAGKPVIYGANGNGPAFIERTADIEQAVRDIISSKTFDNGIVSASEQSVVVDRCISNGVKNEFQKNGAYFMTVDEENRLAAKLFRPDGKSDAEMIGKTAAELAKSAGFPVPTGNKLLIAEERYFSEDSPFSRELLCPVLAYYIEDDWMHACEKCIELLLGDKNGQTLVIHSRDEAVIRLFALKKPVGRVLVNTPAAFGGIGATTNLFPAFTHGSGHTGIGITTDNVSPMNLIYIRKVGYGVRRAEEATNSMYSKQDDRKKGIEGAAEPLNAEVIQTLLKKLLEGM